MTRWNAGATGVRREPVNQHTPLKHRYFWRGQGFYTQEDVAAEAGVSVRAVRAHLARNGSLDTLGAGSGHGPNQRTPVPPKARSITVDDVEYPSIAAFARAKGLNKNRVQEWIARGQLHKLSEGPRKWERRAG